MRAQEFIVEAITRNKVRAALWHEWQQDGWLDQGEQSPEEMDDEEYNDFEDTVDRIVAWANEQGIESSQLAVTKYTMAMDQYTMSHLLTGSAKLSEANSNLNGLHNRKKYQRTLQVLQLAYGEEEGQQMLDQYSQLVDQLIQRGGTVYRGIWVAPGTKPRLKDAGQHWALTLQAAEEYLDSDAGWGAYADFQGDNNDLRPVPYIISATVGPNSITNKDVFFDEFPEEMEVRLINPQAAKMKIVKKVEGLV